MEKPLLLIVLLVLLWFGWDKLWPKRGSHLLSGSKTATIGKASLSVEIAAGNEAISQGLSGRKELPENTGLLFIFPSPGHYSFWMKDMRFPIDIIWIGADKRIVGFLENLSPDSYPKTFSPPLPIQSVIEVNAGWVKRSGVAVGEVAGGY